MYTAISTSLYFLDEQNKTQERILGQDRPGFGTSNMQAFTVPSSRRLQRSIPIATVKEDQQTYRRSWRSNPNHPLPFPRIPLLTYRPVWALVRYFETWKRKSFFLVRSKLYTPRKCNLSIFSYSSVENVTLWIYKHRWHPRVLRTGITEGFRLSVHLHYRFCAETENFCKIGRPGFSSRNRRLSASLQSYKSVPVIRSPGQSWLGDEAIRLHLTVINERNMAP